MRTLNLDPLKRLFKDEQSYKQFAREIKDKLSLAEDGVVGIYDNGELVTIALSSRFLNTAVDQRLRVLFDV